MYQTVTSYAEVKKLLGDSIQCIGTRQGCLAYINSQTGLSRIVLLSKGKPVNSRKRRQK